MAIAYRFVNWKVPPKPDYPLLDNALKDKPSSEDDRAAIMRQMYGVFGAHSSTIKQAGWAWPMHEAPGMRPILVRFRHDSSFHRYYAYSKTELRAVLSPRPVEMYYTDVKGA